MKFWPLPLALALCQPALAQSTTPLMAISGQLETSSGVPIPGCQVSLLNPDIGASSPVTTDASGAYAFTQVPANVRSLYSLQVRCDNQVLYNGAVPHPGVQSVISIPVK